MIRITHAHGSTLLPPQIIEGQFFDMLSGPLELAWEEAE